MFDPISHITALIPSRNREEARWIWKCLCRFGYTKADLASGKIRVGLILDLAQSIRSEK